MNRERALSPKLLVKITPLPIMALGAITLAGEDIDARTLLTHTAINRLGPRFRGDDENLSSLPSEDTEARWVRHTLIYATRY